MVNFGNTAPILTGRRQVAVSHDVGIFDTPESYSFWFRAWYKMLHYALVRVDARIFTASESYRFRIVKCLKVDLRRIDVIYEGADYSRVTADHATLARYGLRSRKFALVLGSLAAHKNFEALDGAAAALAQRGILIAIAGGANRDVFRDIDYGSFAQRKLGRVTDAELRVLYENSVWLLAPSRYEGFGLPPVEAMACGCPVMDARVGAVEEICADDAVYFVTVDQRTITEAVERLLNEDGLAATLSACGRVPAAALKWDASARAQGKVVRELQ